MARILVIEDEPDIQQILEYNLREKGHKVYIAGKGEEGLRIAREKRPNGTPPLQVRSDGTVF